MNERLAACAGPMKMPMAQPSAVKTHLLSTTSARLPKMVRPITETTMASFAPNQSSTQAKPAAPRPAKTFSRMAKIRIS